MLRRVIVWIGLLGWTLGARASAEEPTAEAEVTVEEATVEATAPADERWGGFAIPVASYSGDDGYSAGGRAELVRYEGGVQPYAWRLVFQGMATQSGFHNHWASWEGVNLGPRDRLRHETRVLWRKWEKDGYWGIGSDSLRDKALSTDDPYYSYKLVQPQLRSSFRWDLEREQPLEIFGIAAWRDSTVEVFKDSLLETEVPFGVEGGKVAEATLGLLWERRDSEWIPREGWRLELGARWTVWTWGQGPYGGPMADLRHYLPLGDRSVLASRLKAEWLLGKVPFYEMVHWGGLLQVQGFGGSDSLRGVAVGRWRAPGKAMGNLELRTEVLQHRLFKKPMTWETATFADMGWIWDHDEGQALRPRPGVGAGIRGNLNDSLLGRVDMGYAPDPRRTRDGRIVTEWQPGLYIDFGYPF